MVQEVTVFQLLNKFLALYGLSKVHYHARKRPLYPAKLNFSAIHVFAYATHSHIRTHCLANSLNLTYRIEKEV